MRYQLDTIPVWDAYKAGGECPLCALRAQNEEMYVDSFLGASVMEPDTRVEVCLLYTSRVAPPLICSNPSRK